MTYAVQRNIAKRVGCASTFQSAFGGTGGPSTDNGASDRKAKFFWRAPEGVWKAADSAGEGLKALQRHLNKYDSVVAQLEKQLASAQWAEDFFKILRATAPTLRTIRNMQHTLQQARENFQEVFEIRPTNRNGLWTY
ncbi:MAG: hypothetical protein DRR08_16095 [Candidatus Parabeggiatoa sp. nov. 2]|nr:MAG: hypothetical protein B6247_19235 [Beggiatoa sp. 4572_84]RKZ58566.1 MAG: hypothetical protein DRR08_16095 [Gammaproteobacteria bacterium]